MKKAVLATVIFMAFSLNAKALTFDSDVPQTIRQQMEEDLVFMASIQGAKQTPMHQKVFGNLSGASYKAFFETRITSVGLSSCGGGAAVACVQPYYDPNKMWLTNNFIKFSHPQVARSMVVYHESRHSESQNGNWMHDNCPNPFLDDQGHDKQSIWTGAKLAGQPACDSTPYGSYGSSTIMLKNIAKFCTNCTDKVRMDADIYSTDQLGRINRPDVKKAMLADFAVQ